ncbi:FYVE, RhoGEF and PH domain-containing protein 2 isoform X2 [Ahaetulla prasina]|uniref:FYVE, RhoGEF and PH domain-containing protein 2 isoform X2 n=1 Tax=Ahaetulla prasina TaxID=499056 RepID=UPI002649DA97|nr:FYVE, RhoGEF and PH domain-containing protein 2 isoform X2 [Ahaetulla prasina]
MMEEKQNLPETSVTNLRHIFENFRPCCSSEKEEVLPRLRFQLTTPSPVASSMLQTHEKAMGDIKKAAVIKPGQVQCRAESLEQQQQAPKMLPVKCLSSFRGKITVSNWRAKQASDSQPYFTMQSGSSKNQEPEQKKIALELLETEQAYVVRLHLLDQVFFSELVKEARTTKAFPEDVVKMIFSNISSIYQFHSQFFLPELKKRMEDWDSKPRIGDIIQKVAPFLKMYSEYVKNFDKAMHLITVWLDKALPFQELISNIQKREVSANLTLQHHMLEPIQRIPRYELLLKDYIQKLPLESPDKEDAQKALEMIFTAAKHSNAAIAEMVSVRLRGVKLAACGPDLSCAGHAHPSSVVKSEPVYFQFAGCACVLRAHIHSAHHTPNARCAWTRAVHTKRKHGERLQNLWDVYHRLGLDDDIVDPSNEFIKEGPIQKISFRFSNTSERYLFLFNNLLLYCVPKVIQVGAEFQVRHRIDVNGMKVRELNDVQFPHAFLVSGKQRTLELQARSKEEMDAWLKTFQSAINKKEKRSETFKAASQGQEAETQDSSGQSQELGKWAPQWIRDKLVTMCMRCREPFNAITRRRHHCRACGYVVCARCSEYKAELQYDKNGLKRVCAECYVFLTGNLLPIEQHGKHKGILEKESAEISGQSLMCSFLQLMDKNGKGSMRGWFVIPRDDPLVLYIYAAPQDVKAYASIPLLGYRIKEPYQNNPRHIFQLVQSKQTYTLVAETEELKQRWMKAIEQSARGGEEEDSCDDLE